MDIRDKQFYSSDKDFFSKCIKTTDFFKMTKKKYIYIYICKGFSLKDE